MSDWKNVQYENGRYRTSSGGSGGASNLSDLEDVDLINLINGQILKWNATTEKFENQNLITNDSIKTPMDAMTGTRLFSKFIGSPGNTAETFPFVQFTGTWQDVSGLIIYRQGVAAINFGVNGSYGESNNNLYNIVRGTGATAPSLSYNSTTHILSITLDRYNPGWFIGVTTGAKFIETS